MVYKKKGGEKNEKKVSYSLYHEIRRARLDPWRKPSGSQNKTSELTLSSNVVCNHGRCFQATPQIAQSG